MGEFNPNKIVPTVTQKEKVENTGGVGKEEILEQKINEFVENKFFGFGFVRRDLKATMKETSLDDLDYSKLANTKIDLDKGNFKEYTVIPENKNLQFEKILEGVKKIVLSQEKYPGGKRYEEMNIGECIEQIKETYKDEYYFPGIEYVQYLTKIKKDLYQEDIGEYKKFSGEEKDAFYGRARYLFAGSVLTGEAGRNCITQVITETEKIYGSDYKSFSLGRKFLDNRVATSVSGFTDVLVLLKKEKKEESK